jgi:hypothetical protein
MPKPVRELINASEQYWARFNRMGKIVGVLFSMWGAVFAIWGVYRIFNSAGHDTTETIIIEAGGLVVTILGVLLLAAKPFQLRK